MPFSKYDVDPERMEAMRTAFYRVREARHPTVTGPRLTGLRAFVILWMKGAAAPCCCSTIQARASSPVANEVTINGTDMPSEIATP